MIDLILGGLATWRLTRLLHSDEITAHARHNLIGWTLDNDHPQVRYLVTCAHCLGIWSALAVLLMRRSKLRDLLAIAGVSSLLYDLLEPSPK